MAGVNTATQVANLLETYIVASKATNEYGTIIQKLIWNLPLPHGKGTSVNIPKWGTLSAYSFTRGVSIEQAQQIAISNVTVSPSSIAVHFVLDKYANEVAREDVMGKLGMRAGEAMNRFKDVDILSLLDGFSRTVGAGGTANIGHLMAAYTILTGGSGGTKEPAEPPFNVLMHPNTYHAIAEDLGGLTTGMLVSGSTNVIAGDGAFRDSILQKFLVKQLAGLNIYLAGNLPVSSGVAKGGIINHDALIYTPFDPQITEKQYDVKLQGWDVVTSEIYGSGEFDDDFGVEGNWAAATPTA